MEEAERWFASRTRFGQEISIKRKLTDLGIQSFIPTRIASVTRRGKETDVERPVINNLVFLRSTKSRACSLANEYGIPLHYFIDRVSGSLLIVPDKQMDDFIRVLESSEKSNLLEQTVAVGDRVKVIKGELRGVEGNVLETDEGKTFIVVSLIGLLQAKARIPREALAKI